MLFLEGPQLVSLINISDSTTLVFPKSTATVVIAPVFGQNPIFGEDFTSKHKFISYRQLAQNGNMTMNHKQTCNQKSSPDKRFRYSLRSYGQKPIVEPFFPLKKPVTISLDFETFDNFGTLK